MLVSLHSLSSLPWPPPPIGETAWKGAEEVISMGSYLFFPGIFWEPKVCHKISAF